jgi:hypothetical protein
MTYPISINNPNPLLTNLTFIYIKNSFNLFLSLLNLLTNLCPIVVILAFIIS